MSSTQSRSQRRAASRAMVRCPLWTGSKVPPKRAILNARSRPLFQNLDLDVAEVCLHRRAFMQLQRDHSGKAGRVMQIGGYRAVQLDLNVVAVAEDLVGVPVF